MISINTTDKDLDDVGLLFHSVLRYGEENADRLDRSIMSIGYGTLLSNVERAAVALAKLCGDEGEDWDGCVWLERLEDIEQGSLAQQLYDDGVDVEAVVVRYLTRFCVE